MADLPENPDSFYQRPSVREVYDTAQGLRTLRERREYLLHVIMEDEHGGFLRDPEMTDDGQYIEWYDFTHQSVSLSRGAIPQPDRQAEFDRRGEYFRSEVSELLSYFEEVGDPASAAQGEENVTLLDANHSEEERIPWMGSQNLFAAWVRLSYKAFMTEDIDPYRKRAPISKVVEATSALFDTYDEDQDVWTPASPNTVGRKGVQPELMEEIVMRIGATKKKLIAEKDEREE